MKRLHFLTLFLLASATSAFAQSASCAQVLRLVRTTYEQGRLHELPDLMGSCLNGVGDRGFTKDEKREALRYLTLAYIYLEEPEQADASMLKLLETDHFYTINDAVDPAEFVALYKKFRTYPLFRIGIKLGPNYTLPTIMKNYYVGAEAAGQGSFSPGIGFQLGVVFEKDFKFLKNRFTLAGEFNVVSGRKFSYSNPSLTTVDGTTIPANTQTTVINQGWMDLNAIAQYKVITNKYNWYVGLGPGVNMILSSENQISTTLVNTFTVTGPAVNDTNSFNKFNYSAVVVVGGRLRVGEVYVNGELRYQYGLNNVINPATRSNPETLLDYGFQYNDFRINSLSVTLGILYPYFKPKKLIK